MRNHLKDKVNNIVVRLATQFMATAIIDSHNRDKEEFKRDYNIDDGCGCVLCAAIKYVESLRENSDKDYNVFDKDAVTELMNAEAALSALVELNQLFGRLGATTTSEIESVIDLCEQLGYPETAKYFETGLHSRDIMRQHVKLSHAEMKSKHTGDNHLHVGTDAKPATGDVPGEPRQEHDVVMAAAGMNPDGSPLDS